MILWGCFCSAATEKCLRHDGKMDGAKCRAILGGNLLETAKNDTGAEIHLSAGQVKLQWKSLDKILSMCWDDKDKRHT